MDEPAKQALIAELLALGDEKSLEWARILQGWTAPTVH